MEIQQGIKEFLIEIEVRKYTPRTIRGYRNNLNLFLRFCTEHEIAAIENVTLATVKQFTRAMTCLLYTSYTYDEILEFYYTDITIR